MVARRASIRQTWPEVRCSAPASWAGLALTWSVRYSSRAWLPLAAGRGGSAGRGAKTSRRQVAPGHSSSRMEGSSQPCSRPAAHAHQPEQLAQTGVAGVAHAARQSAGGFHEKAARIGDVKPVAPLFDGQAPAVLVVRVNQGVGQRLPHRQLHRMVRFAGQAGVGADAVGRREIKIKQRAVPVRAVRAQAAGKTGLQLLPVGKAEMGPHRTDGPCFAQHQKPGGGGAERPVFGPGQHAQPQQQARVAQLTPHMAGAAMQQPGPVAGHRVGAEGALVQPLQRHQIPGQVRLVPHHGPHLLGGAVIVPLAAPPVSAGKGVGAQIHRPVVAAGTGHMDNHNPVAAALVHPHVGGAQDVGAHPGRVVHDLPELAHQLLRVRQGHRGQGLVLGLDHAQQNQPAEGVGKGGVGLPDAAGQSALGALCLQAVVLPVFF